jgi:anti-anti-sigma factor
MNTAISKFAMQEAGPTCLVLRCEGVLSWDDRDVLANDVEAYFRPRPLLRDVVLDFAAVKFVNSAGLGALFQLTRRLRERQGQLVFANVPPLLTRVFNAVGLDRIAKVAPDLSAAFVHCGVMPAPAGGEPSVSLDTQNPPPA